MATHDLLVRGATLATCADRTGVEARDAAGEPDRALRADGAFAVAEGRIAWVGPTAAYAGSAARTIDAEGALVTPGLIDCHTHLVFAGDRADEFAQRLAGASYEAIARAGGGIASTVARTRAAGEDALFAESLPRARALVAGGATTIEIKSGYGLEPEAERRMLRVARRIGAALGITVRSTYLGLHALPAEHRARREAYVAGTIETLQALQREGLVDAVDAYCEGIGFTPEETRRLFDAALALGLPVKLHADQLSNLGGAALVAQYRGLSADHIEHTDAAAVAAMAAAGTVAVLLPGAYYALRETRLPPIEALRAHGVRMAVSTDLNPGTSPLLSLPQAMSFACTLFRLTTDEALRGTTIEAAHALGLADRKGSIEVGKDADFALWDERTPAALSYWIGGLRARRVFVRGVELAR